VELLAVAFYWVPVARQQFFRDIKFCQFCCSKVSLTVEYMCVIIEDFKIKINCYAAAAAMTFVLSPCFLSHFYNA